MAEDTARTTVRICRECGGDHARLHDGEHKRIQHAHERIQRAGLEVGHG